MAVGGHPLTRKHILFADDDEAILRVIARVLHRDRHRWDMTFVVGGRAAVDQLRRETFDALVTDYDMPDMTGKDVLAAALQYCPKLPCIVFTGGASSVTSSNAFAVLSKAEGAGALRQTLERALAVDEGQE